MNLDFTKLNGLIPAVVQDASDGEVLMRDVLLAARGYSVFGGGTISLEEGEMDFGARLLASPALSRDLASLLPLARFLMDSKGRVDVPLKLTGRLPDIDVRPNMKLVLPAVERALRGQVR